MNAGRWYPTNTTMPNGDVLVVSGDIDTSQVNPLPQVWQIATGTWRDLTTAQLSLPLYPFMFLTSDGRVFQAGPNQNSRYLDTAGTGTWTPVANSAFGLRDYGSAVMYDDNKVLIVGGGDPTTNTAEVIDLNAATPAWRTVAPMAHRRRQTTATLLPDGTVLITGGSSANGFDNATGAVLPIEMWDPLTEQFTALAPMTAYRGYHSVAVLLPDGRVLSTGGDTTATSAEIYSPPYLFKGARPTVTDAPAVVGYGKTFNVATPDGARITAVNLIRLTSVTHAFNMEQRINRLAFVATPTGLTLSAPASPTIAPPGYYLLFALDLNGVPSVGRFVQLASGAPGSLTMTDPSEGEEVSGTVLFSGYLEGRDLNTYRLHWQVDGDRLNPMADSLVGGPHKEAAVDVSTWNWRGAGPYALNFVAQALDGSIIAEQPVNIMIGSVPAAPSGLTAAVVSATQINLGWTDNATNETSYKIERCAGAGCVTYAHIAQVGAGVTAFDNAGLVAGTTYNYRVRATTSSSNSPYSNVATATTGGAPVAPSGLSATAVTAPQINLVWQDNATNETAYLVERCQAGCAAFAQIAQLAANITTYNDPGLIAGETYTYRVRAQNAQAYSAYSNNAAATTQGGIPAAPSNVTGSGVARGQIRVNWTDNAGNENGFKLERCINRGCLNFTELAVVGANATTYLNTGLTRRQVYRYRLRSFNADGNSPYSNIVTITSP
ncbi:MAG TPA: galactose oxidase-like domain-containing protein [Vicinamibacterales bacterium]|nr:galactose oxidase-like domain-containing protein [Vicinamibacterales bacterium]